MCLAIPGKVIKVDPATNLATIDYEAERREASTILVPEVKAGDYVLVQAKMIVLKVPDEEAKAALEEIRNADRTLMSR